MPRDGSGDFSRAVTPPNNGDVTNATDFNTEMNDIATALSDSINKSGTKAMAANLPMGGFKVTGLAASASNGDAVRHEQLTALSGVYQPLDATLTALAALSWSSGNALVQFTAADTVSLTLTPSVTDITLSGVGKGAAGSASAPSWSFSGDTNTGIYSVGADQLGIATGGVLRINFTTAQVFSTLPLRASDGDVSAPGLSFANDVDNGFYRIGANNWAGSVGGAKFLDVASSLIDFSVATRAKGATSAEASGTLTAASANKTVVATGGITIDGNVFAAGDVVAVYAGASARTITQGSTGSPTQRLAGTSSTGNFTLAARGWMIVYFVSATEWILVGNVS